MVMWLRGILSSNLCCEVALDHSSITLMFNESGLLRVSALKPAKRKQIMRKMVMPQSWIKATINILRVLSISGSPCLTVSLSISLNASEFGRASESGSDKCVRMSVCERESRGIVKGDIEGEGERERFSVSVAAPNTLFSMCYSCRSTGTWIGCHH